MCAHLCKAAPCLACNGMYSHTEVASVDILFFFSCRFNLFLGGVLHAQSYKHFLPHKHHWPDIFWAPQCMFPLRFAAPVKTEMLFLRHAKAGHHHSASPRAQHCLSMVVPCSTDKQRPWKRIQHSGISAHDWFAQTYLLVFSAQGELICNRRP